MSSPASATHPLAGHAGAHAHPDMDATYRKITWTHEVCGTSGSDDWRTPVVG